MSSDLHDWKRIRSDDGVFDKWRCSKCGRTAYYSDTMPPSDMQVDDRSGRLMNCAETIVWRTLGT